MCNYGLKVMLDTSRFWASRLEYNETEDRYEIKDIMGPDEYSEHVNNNAFTNYMVKWQIDKTLHDSSLSQSIHAIVAADMDDIKKAYEYFQESIRIDLGKDLTCSWDGLHAVSLGGNW